MFAVVCFIETNELDVAPEKWIQHCENDTICLWPPYKTNTRLTKAKTTVEAPCDGWEEYQVKILYKSAGIIQMVALMVLFAIYCRVSLCVRVRACMRVCVCVCVCVCVLTQGG
jgi:hypothetical protein